MNFNFYINIFASRLKALRNSLGITQVELAKQLLITKASVSNLENCRKNPSLEIVISLALFFNVSVDYLLGLSENRER